MEVLMPFDAMMVSAGVMVVFIVFAGVLAWADRQTGSKTAVKSSNTDTG
jgi:cbb3-type cytochrome oxidase subunit 3